MDFNGKFLIGTLLAVFLGLSIFFRDNISRLLEFGEYFSGDRMVKIGEDLTPVHTVPVKTPEAKDGDKKELGKRGAIAETLPQFHNAFGAPLPSYSGRDPAEIRPVPEEIKLFTEDQKLQLFNSISTEGKAVKLNPMHFNGWITVGGLKKTIGDFEGARDAWEYASLVEPLNSLSFSNLGELYWRYLHDYPKSEANLKISIEHKPNDIQNYTSLAELYHYSYKEKYDLADDVLLDGLKVNPDNGTLERRLAYLYEQRNEWKTALEWWNKILEAFPDDEAVKNSIDKVKTKLGGGNN